MPCHITDCVDLHLLKPSHLCVNLLGTSLVTGAKRLKGNMTILRGLIVAAQGLLELTPQLLHCSLQLDPQGMLLLNILKDVVHSGYRSKVQGLYICEFSVDNDLFASARP